jgi:poly-gamma-glutamate synthase PgsB/CapB
VLPDGEEVEVVRHGLPSVIEQKKVVKMAKDVSADCLVAEIMSVHPENHYVESRQIFKPHIVVVTNVRRDHADAMGKTEEEIASVFCLTFPPKRVVFVPEKEDMPLFQQSADDVDGKMIRVKEGIASSQNPGRKFRGDVFFDHIDLVYAVVKHLKIDDKVIFEGIRKASSDAGAYRMWEYRSEAMKKVCYFVNGFAANDPESTYSVLTKTKESLPSSENKIVGLLNLRFDRGDRTLQWMEALTNGFSECFDGLFVMGDHARIFQKKVRDARVLKEKTPERIMEKVIAASPEDAVIFGFGNMGGLGRRLVDHWDGIGSAYGV